VVSTTQVVVFGTVHWLVASRPTMLTLFALAHGPHWCCPEQDTAVRGGQLLVTDLRAAYVFMAGHTLSLGHTLVKRGSLHPQIFQDSLQSPATPRDRAPELARAHWQALAPARVQVITSRLRPPSGCGPAVPGGLCCRRGCFSPDCCYDEP
jgi:hypothetical protein